MSDLSEYYIDVSGTVHIDVGGQTFTADHDIELTLSDLIDDFRDQIELDVIHDFIEELDNAQSDMDFSVKLFKTIAKGIITEFPEKADELNHLIDRFDEIVKVELHEEPESDEQTDNPLNTEDPIVDDIPKKSDAVESDGVITPTVLRPVGF